MSSKVINSINDGFELSCAAYVKRYYKIILSNTDIKYYKVGFKMVKAEEVKEAIDELLRIEEFEMVINYFSLFTFV